jgi:23S rRNA (uracil1939-C5)-methyltransferase
MRRKFKPYILEDIEIIDAGSEGKAVAKVDGQALFVPYGVPGDIVDVQITNKKKGYMEGKIVAIIKPSPHRIDPTCQHFGVCGGCKWQILDYPQQLMFKQKQVKDNFKHIGKFEYPEINPIIGSDKQYYYRNKLEYTFSNLRWLEDEDMKQRDAGIDLEVRGIGFHVPGKFDKVVDVQHCSLQADPSNQIRLAIKTFAIEYDIPFYNLRSHEGVLRNLIIRTATTGELLVILSMTELNESTHLLLEHIEEQFPQITSLQYVINNKLNDTISDLDIKLFHGKPFIAEKMEDLEFMIGPISFYQTNSEQAYRLYKVAKEFAQIEQEDVVYDLYTGTGTIANFVAREAKKVVGIEYLDDAIKDAHENSKNNDITNTAFFAGDIKDVLSPGFVKKQGTPSIVITDPPRAGMHANVIERLLEMEAKRIVYVSCNPATQARDITLLSSKYRVTKIQPVDMFPHTHHVENVVLLELNR